MVKRKEIIDNVMKGKYIIKKVGTRPITGINKPQLQKRFESGREGKVMLSSDLIGKKVAIVEVE